MEISEPWGFVLSGLVLQGIGIGIVLGSDEDALTGAGYALAGVGSLLVLVAVIAFGVAMGLRDHDTRADA